MASTILITGTSSGIGRATALLFQSRGWNVVASMRAPERETELTTLDNTLVVRIDVTEEASIAPALDQAFRTFGGIDVLVNNAGYGAYGLIEATALKDIRKEFETNVIGMLAMAKAVIPHFRARRRGTIINLSSVGGKVAMPLGSLYHGSKFAVEGATEALQYEMAAIGVSVKLIEPGNTRSDFAGRSLQFNNDDRLVEYGEIVPRTMAAFEKFQQQAGDTASVAQTIYRAATDGEPELRYPSGKDAEQLLQSRKTEDDATFTERLRKLFDLDATPK
jgi:NAD(P)-dependent dehydrogenase (short-subunit alcohol dehydrogenase family)